MIDHLKRSEQFRKDHASGPKPIEKPPHPESAEGKRAAIEKIPFGFPRPRKVEEAEMEKAMGPRENPAHPMFRDHNCPACGSGKTPCRRGNPSLCDYPHARND